MANIFDLFKQISKENNAPTGPVTHIVAGLGNPGAKYAQTRHNAGFMALDYIEEKYNFKTNKVKFKSLVGETTFAGKRVLFMRPQTFMNLSGEAIREAADFYKVPSDNIIIIYDDVSFDPGTMRIKRKGSAGGHNGIKNIILQLDTDVFPRIKLGVGIKPKDYDMVDWVLGKLPPDTHKDFFSTLENVPAALELIISGQLDKAMNKYN
ncbi:MAG: aminoacyl-tRNA hydrolase [Clostridia bacterium]|nr:aminoacyl-tRNA hydrolase [Clostridia bacterium]